MAENIKMEQAQKKIKILLIDDDEMMRIYFRDIFWIHSKNDAYDVKMVSTLEEAEKVIADATTRPDTIFLDVLMSSKGSAPAFQIARSLKFIDKVKKDKNLSNINIVIYSGQKEQYLKEAALQLGIDGYLVKGELMPREIMNFIEQIHESNNKN